MFRIAPALLAIACVAASLPARAAPGDPAWLVLRPGSLARVDLAPWAVSDEPEAALTLGAASSARDYTADAERPGDVAYEPIGVSVRVVRVVRAGVALVHGRTGRWQAYTRLERLIPDVPPGTALVAAGGFGGFADFYPTLGTKQPQAERLATGSGLAVLGTDVAPYDPDSSDLVRLHVRVTSGTLRGRSGWVAASYAGLPRKRLPADASVAERACACRLVQFDDLSRSGR